MSKKISSVHVEMSADSSKLEAGLKKTKGSLEDLKRQSQKTTSSFSDGWKRTGLIIGGVTTALGVAAKAFDMFMDNGRAGAELEFTAGKFDRLSRAVGTTSQLLKGDLKDATKGLVSDAELVQSATNFMTLGLAKTHDEVVRLTTVAGALGMDMNQLVLTLTNQTTMRFDALGISVDGFDAKVEALKKTGMDANAAFKEAFLQQAEEQLKKVGNRADSTVAAFDRLTVASKNLGDTIKLKLAKPAAAAAETLADLLNGVGTSDKQQQEIEDLRGEIESSANSYRDYIEQMIDAGIASGKLKKEYRELVDVWDNPRQLMTLIHVVGAWTEAEYKAARATSTAARSARDARNGIYDLAQATNAEGLSLSNLETPLDNVSKRLFGFPPIVEKAIGPMYDAAAAAEEARSKFNAWKGTLQPTVSLLDQLNSMNMNFGDAIKDQLDKLKWDQMGGAAVQGVGDTINWALQTGKITKPQADAMLSELLVASDSLAAEINGTDFNALAQNLADDLHVPLDVAAQKATAAIDAIRAGELETFVYKIQLEYITPTLPTPPGYSGPYSPKNSPKGPPKAAGGNVSAGVSYPVGERGIEMFTPSVPGVITPNHALGGSNMTVVQNFYTLPGQSPQAIAANSARQLSNLARRNRAGLGYAGA